MAVISTGFFDGVHIGHRSIIDTLVREARRRAEKSVVLTFWPHPRVVLRSDSRDLRLLTSRDEKLRMLRALGVDEVEVLPFTSEFASLTTRQFLSDVVKGRFGASAIVLGYDNCIGSDLCSVDTTRGIACELGLDVVSAPVIADNGVSVSSTKIRSAVENGQMRTARAMLGYDYGLEGVVVSGNRLGRTIGFPTANLKLYEPMKLVPGRGVYATRVRVEGRDYLGMTNVGVRPTVSGDGGDVRIETNIFDFDEDIYGLDLSLSFIEKIRDERRFSSLEELAGQLRLDKACCISEIGKYCLHL